jgi:hypothetical protein
MSRQGLAVHKIRKRRTLTITGTYDVECANWTSFIVGVTYHVKDGAIVHRTARSMAEYMLIRGGTWWSHNGGKYDTLCILEEMRTLGHTMSMSYVGGRVTRAMGSGLVLCDSYSILPMKLETACEMTDISYSPLAWRCLCGSDCGGYCGISTSMSRDRVLDLANHCVADCEVLLAALQALSNFAEQYNIDLSGTVGGSSWSTVRRRIGIPDAWYLGGQWRRIREGYYSGRCQVFRPRERKTGHHWDLSSAYPASLAFTALPVGDPVEHGAREAQSCLRRHQPGIYCATVNVPVSNIPPLPWRWGNGTAFPVGLVSGVWSLPEIEFALQRGCKIEGVGWGIVWEKEEVLFRDIMTEMSALRVRLGKKSAWGVWIREFCNSLTGKFAEQPERTFVRLNPPQREIKYCVGKPPCTTLRCSKSCNSYRQVDDWGELWTVPYFRQATCGYIQWAAYLTSVARVELSLALETQGMDIVYTDTDSLWTTGKTVPMPSGDRIGEWSYKHSWSDFEAAAPKSYAYTDGDTGVRHIVTAGARVTPEEWTAGHATIDRGVAPLLDAARESRGLFRPRRQEWVLPHGGRETGWYGDRLLDSVTGTTYPVTCEQLRRRIPSSG